MGKKLDIVLAVIGTLLGGAFGWFIADAKGLTLGGLVGLGLGWVFMDHILPGISGF